MIDVRVADKQADNTSRGGFRTFYEWLTGTTTPHLSSNVPTEQILPARIGRYAIEHRTYEDTRTAGPQGGDRSEVAIPAPGEQQAVGTDVSAPDDLPSLRFVPGGNR